MDISERSKRIEEAAVKINNMSRGITIVHVVEADMLGVNYKSTKYWTMHSSLNRLLIKNYGIFLSNVNREGYKIMESGHEIDIPDSQCARSIRRYSKAVKDMNHIRIDTIKDEQLKQRTIRIAQDRANTLGLLKLGTVTKAISD
jgi:hypothetical protein